MRTWAKRTTCRRCDFPTGGDDHLNELACMSAWRAKANKHASYLLKRPEIAGAAEIVRGLKKQLDTYAPMLFSIALARGGELEFELDAHILTAQAGHKVDVSIDEDTRKIKLRVEKLGREATA